MANLESVTTVTEFKEVAKELLLDDSGMIGDIIRVAHGLQKADGGKKMIWLFFSLRDNLNKVRSEFAQQVIKRALRSSKPTADIPRDWLK